MTPEQIAEPLNKEPFEAFLINLANGDRHEVRDPNSVAIMGTRIFVALPNDRWVFIPLRHIASIESAQAA